MTSQGWGWRSLAEAEWEMPEKGLGRKGVRKCGEGLTSCLTLYDLGPRFTHGGHGKTL